MLVTGDVTLYADCFLICCCCRLSFIVFCSRRLSGYSTVYHWLLMPSLSGPWGWWCPTVCLWQQCTPVVFVLCCFATLVSCFAWTENNNATSSNGYGMGGRQPGGGWNGVTQDAIDTIRSGARHPHHSTANCEMYKKQRCQRCGALF